MDKYYVSGVTEQDGACEMCADEIAQFWTVYVRDEQGLSQGIIDLTFREDAEAAMAVYVERDALQQQVNALAVECGIMRQLLPDYVSVPVTDAATRELQAQGADKVLRALVTSDDDDFSDAPTICAMVAYDLRNGEQGGDHA